MCRSRPRPPEPFAQQLSFADGDAPAGDVVYVSTPSRSMSHPSQGDAEFPCTSWATGPSVTVDEPVTSRVAVLAAKLA